MHIRRFGVTLCAFFTAGALVSAQTRFDADRFKAHVTFLADDLLEGREAGTRGHEIAARYIATQFALLGLKPGGDNGTFFQQVNLIETALAGAPPTVTITTPRGRQTFENKSNVVVRGPMAAGKTAISGPLVFVGFGMEDAAVGYDDYKGLDVRGKIVVALLGVPKGIDSEIAAHLRNEQLRVAAAHGAVALVWISTHESERAFPWTTVLDATDAPVTSWVQADATPYDSSAGLKASVIAEHGVAATLFEGARQTLAQVQDQADNGRPQGFPLQASMDIAVELSERRYSSPEVIGIIEGSDPVLKNEYVALMGHSDHIGVKPTGDGDRINNGALDNAAGTATLIEVARAFMTDGRRPRRSILVVANTAEEKGLLGAEFFAHYPTVPIDRITAAIDLDMPLLLYDFTDAVAYGAGHSSLETLFAHAGAAMGVTMSPDPMPEQTIFVRSDHYAMAKVGVPAVMLATGMANGGAAAWAKFLGTNYHQPSDDLAQPIVWAAGAKFAELNYRVVQELADAPAPARWYEADYFGNLFAPKAPKAPRPAPLR